MIETALYTLLRGSSAIAALVGARIYPLVLPTLPTLPALTYQIISAVAEPTLDTRGTRKYRVQLDGWGDDYGDAANLREAVTQALDGYADGTLLSCWLTMKTDYFEQDARQYRAMVEFYILATI